MARCQHETGAIDEVVALIDVLPDQVLSELFPLDALVGTQMDVLALRAHEHNGQRGGAKRGPDHPYLRQRAPRNEPGQHRGGEGEKQRSTPATERALQEVWQQTHDAQEKTRRRPSTTDS